MSQSQRRMEDLAGRFRELEGQLQEGAVKDALSVLHAMLQEMRRAAPAGGAAQQPAPGGVTLEDVATLYKHAPGMQGSAENEGLPVGTKAPDFMLLDGSGQPVSLSDFRGKTVVLVFYPLDWSPACSDQLSLYQSELSEFQRHNAQILAISVDSLYSHGAWAAVRGITFPLLADFHPKGDVARKYQVLRETNGFSERALFVIDPEGTIRYREVSQEIHKIPDIYTLMDQLQKLSGAVQEGSAHAR